MSDFELNEALTTLDGEDKRDLALALSVNAALESRDAEPRGMFSTTQLWTTLSITLIGYMASVAAPEPVSKGVAGPLALLMWGYLGWELFDLVRAWFQLGEEAAEASTFAELREAGERFGLVGSAFSEVVPWDWSTGCRKSGSRLPPGTIEFRAPEAWRFSRENDSARYDYGPADEPWALGVTFYWLTFKVCLEVWDLRAGRGICDRAPPWAAPVSGLLGLCSSSR